MSDGYYSKLRDRWSVTGADTNGGGITITKAAPSSTRQQYVAQAIQCSGDAAALVTIESPSGTVLYRKRFAAAFNYSETFPLGTIVGAGGAAMLVTISAGTTNTEANLQGATLGAA